MTKDELFLLNETKKTLELKTKKAERLMNKGWSSSPDEASWVDETGVLLSITEAKTLISFLNNSNF